VPLDLASLCIRITCKWEGDEGAQVHGDRAHTHHTMHTTQSNAPLRGCRDAFDWLKVQAGCLDARPHRIGRDAGVYKVHNGSELVHIQGAVAVGVSSTKETP
jgi:hypothetical protein